MRCSTKTGHAWFNQHTVITLNHPASPSRKITVVRNRCNMTIGKRQANYIRGARW